MPPAPTPDLPLDPAEIARFAAEPGPGCTTGQLRTFIVTIPWESWTPGQGQP